jgi:cobalt-zinc-cadmium efflux system outer membrane protein
MLKETVLPAAQLAFAAGEKGYQEGKFGFLEVLDAQRTLFDAKSQYVEAAAQYQKFKTLLERLIGQELGGQESAETVYPE